ncbi:hypothetical protein [Sphingobacterium mizutaii]|uniref:hypothetical protein n=1 Tax=Sphingobacterium mizutaii TaxID=1010 RepID=UPI0028AC89AA|nr:hypothetical protein [Sphingobacterium mizutaii]
MEENYEFFGLIVLYNPDTNLYLNNISTLLDLNINVIIYDNSTQLKSILEHEDSIFKLNPNIQFFHNNAKNLGLSFAFNDAISRISFENERNGLILFDQDSKINQESIKLLKEEYSKLILEDNFGILAGMPYRINGEKYRIRPTKNSIKRGDLIEVYQVPSSYSLIPIRTFKRIGNFEPDFFIDQIDNNFSLRCRQHGLKIYVNEKASFTHDIGLGSVMFFGKFLFPYSTVDRHYYQTRNLILSMNRYQGKKSTLIKLLIIRCLIVAYIGVVKGNFFERLKYTYFGILDGFKNKSGKYQIR